MQVAAKCAGRYAMRIRPTMDRAGGAFHEQGNGSETWVTECCHDMGYTLSLG